ncbi:MAG: alpha/beta fold hydrolase [Hyphomonadaceae bacterium]
MPRDTFASFDGVRLSYRLEGEGRPVLMLHGFLANSRFNWIEPGIAAAVTAAGFQAIMLDHRGHGHSEAPQDARFYPPDVLAQDAEAFVVHLGLSDYDLVGYSLGARTAVRMLVRGARPRRCVLGGMGDSGVLGSTARVAFFEDAIGKGEAGAFSQAAKVVQALIARAQIDPQVALNVLRSQTQTERAPLASIDTPILCVSGVEDHDNGSAEGLAALFPNAQATRIHGNHLSAVNAELGEAIVEFLQRA